MYDFDSFYRAAYDCVCAPGTHILELKGFISIHHSINHKVMEACSTTDKSKKHFFSSELYEITTKLPNIN